MTQEDSIKYADEIERINRMTIKQILDMKGLLLVRLTQGFCEPLVRKILSKAYTCDEQQDLMSHFYEMYGAIKRTKPQLLSDTEKDDEGWPKFFSDFEYYIASTYLITEDGTKPELQPARLIITPLTGSVDFPYAKDYKDIVIAERKVGEIDSTLLAKNTKLNEENAKLNRENRSLNEENAKLNKENHSLNEENAELNRENRSLNEENAKLLEQLKECMAQPKVNGMQEAGNDEWLLELLEYHFLPDEREHVRDFIEEIRGKDDPTIADIILEWKDKKRISQKTFRGPLWRILHAAKLYNGTESNYNTALNRRLRE